MEEDAEALETLYADILSIYPPGPKRAYWLAELRRIVPMTRCPHWPLGRERFLLKLRGRPVPPRPTIPFSGHHPIPRDSADVTRAETPASGHDRR